MTPEALSREGSPAPPTMLGLPQTATMAGGEITLHAAPAVVEEVTTTAGGPHFLGKTLEVKTTNFNGKIKYLPHYVYFDDILTCDRARHEVLIAFQGPQSDLLHNRQRYFCRTRSPQ